MKKTTNLLWIGLAASDSVYNELLKKGYFHFAAQSAQKNFIEGITECTNIKIDEISGFMMPTFPHIKELVTKSYHWKTVNGGEGISVDNLNIHYLDVVVRTIKIKNICREWAKKHLEDNNVIFVYSAVNAYLQGAMEIKKICKNVKIYLIITDLPQFMELKPSKIKKILKKLNWKSLNCAIKKCDGWIVFTKHMISYLKLPFEKCLVIEGSVNSKNISLEKEENILKTEKIIVMYSGSLGLRYGIPELLEAFSKIDDSNYELWFTGKGEAESLISEYAKNDERIKNFGFLSSYQEFLKLQKKSSMLMNTRMPNEKASSYCFPSKIFDYMLVGKPVLSFKIEGIPDEYYQYLEVIKSTDPNEIKKSILKVGNMSVEERKKMGERGKQFIINEKNNIFQCKKICDFIGLEIQKRGD